LKLINRNQVAAAFSLLILLEVWRRRRTSSHRIRATVGLQKRSSFISEQSTCFGFHKIIDVYIYMLLKQNLDVNFASRSSTTEEVTRKETTRGILRSLTSSKGFIYKTKKILQSYVTDGEKTQTACIAGKTHSFISIYEFTTELCGTDVGSDET